MKDYLINYIKTMAFEKRGEYGNSGWIVAAFRDGGVPPEVIFNALNEMFETKVCLFLCVC